MKQFIQSIKKTAKSMTSKFILVSIIVFTALQLQAQWENVGSPGFSAGATIGNSTAVDANGTTYMVFRDATNTDKATVMKFVGSNWVFVGNAGFSAGGVSETKIAIDPSGTPFVAYEDWANSDMVSVMKFNGTAWQNVGNPGFSDNNLYAGSLSLSIDANGIPFVAFSESKATVMKFNGSSWEYVGSRGFSAGSTSSISLAIDDNDTPYVSYVDGTSFGATVQKFNGIDWEIVGVHEFSAGIAEYVSLAINSSGVPYVAYKDRANSDQITVMRFNGSVWENVGSAGFPSALIIRSSSLAIAPDDSPYVLFKAYDNIAFRYRANVMTFNSTIWEYVGTPMFSASDANSATLAFDDIGTLYVGYSDSAYSGKATVMKYPAPTPPIPLNNWAIVLGVFFIAVFMVIRYRRKLA